VKRIGVTQRVAVDPQSGERRDALDQRFATWLAKADLLLFPLPNRWAERSALQAWLVALKPAGLILSGGPDLGVAPERDRTESDALDWAASERLPVLGICRGMQMLALRAGATLVSVAGHVGGEHEITDARGREARRLVNSFHRLGLRVCPPDYQPLAWAQDGTIEAMRHCSLPWEGWMWHPERESSPQEKDLHRLREFFALPTAARESGAASTSDRP
jgi:putative glutamine amidotransferase